MSIINKTMTALIVSGVTGFGFLALICVLQLLRRDKYQPDFRFRGYMNIEKLAELLSQRALEDAEIKDSGGGLDLSLIGHTLKKGGRVLINKTERGGELFGFEKWLFDNYYLLEGQLKSVKENLKALSNLPAVDGLSRVYRIASMVIKHSEGSVEEESLKLLISAYQKQRPLTYRELISLPLAFRYALLEYAAILMSKSIVINRKILSGKKADIYAVNNSLKRNITSNAFVYGVNSRININSARLDELLKENGSSLQERLDSFYRQLVRYNTFTERVFGSIRSMDEFLNTGFAVSLSTVNKAFLREDAGVYKNMSLKSKCEYLERVSALSKKHNKSEFWIGERTLIVANERNMHIGSVLIDEPFLLFNKRKPNKRLKECLYTMSVIVLSLILSVLFAIFIDIQVWIKVLLFFVTFPLSWRVVRTAYLYAFSHTLPRIVPEIDLGEGIPDNERAMLTVSRLIKDKQELEAAVDSLEVLAAANPDKNLSFALLIDLLPAKTDETEADNEIVEFINSYKGYKERDIRIYLRKRSFNKEARMFSGYERKRGALMNLNEHLLHGSNYFKIIKGGARDVKYIIALDADTMLNSARELIGAAMHPLNSYAKVITPELSVNPRTCADSFFSDCFNSRRGTTAYNGYSCDINFRLFGKGNYCGKGIYNIKDFHEATNETFPDNTLLSHDYIEGAVAGTAQSGAECLEDAPENYPQWITRTLRWMRGDIQLLKYIFPFARNRAGKRIRNKISPSAKLNIFSNIIETLIPVSLVLLITMAAFVNTWFIAGVVIAALVYPFVYESVYIIRGIISGCYVGACRRFAALAGRIVHNTATLFHRAMLTVCIHTVTLYRIFISRKNLLKWQTFVHAGSRGLSLKKYAVMFIVNYVALILFVLAAVFMPAGMMWLTLTVGGILLLAPFICFFYDKKRVSKIEKSALYEEVAKETWDYFEKQFEQGFLVSDNFQEDYQRGYADRTSPTNIGFSLLSVMSAYELGFVDGGRMLEIAEGIVSAIENLAKWNGHLYNWYNPSAGKAMNPKYVSTVDSGNLLACFITTAGALESFDGIDGQRKDNLIVRINKLVSDTDFRPFVNEKKGLLCIGYNDSTKMFDKGHYDLLASEAALTYYILVAVGKIDKSFWYNLGRRQVRYAGNTLCSWAGGMFEYLMPFIFIEAYPQTLLSESNKNAVKAQIRYAKKHKLPAYGISESQYNRTDDKKNYQYMAFGVNNISLRPGGTDKVITPYASILGAEYAGKKCVKNLEAISYARNKYGYYEAIDNGKTIKTHMSHHQGMILASLHNVLRDGIIRKWFNSSPEMRSAHMLMCEETPQNSASKKIVIRKIRDKITEQYSETVTVRKANLLTNGKYSVVVDNEGRGFSSFGVMLTRSKGVLNDDSLSVINIIDKDGRRNISQNSECIFDEYKSVYKSKSKLLEITQEIFVPSDINADVRRVLLHNKGSVKMSVTLESYSEIVLRNQAADIAHHAFNSMFVVSEYNEADGCLIFRNLKEEKLFFAHAAAVDGKRINAGYESNKANYFGRGSSAPKTGNVLDPIASLTVNVDIAPGEIREVCFGSFAARGLDEFPKMLENLYKKDFVKHAYGALQIYGGYKSLGAASEKRLRDIASMLLYGDVPKLNKRILHDGGFARNIRMRGINISNPVWLTEYSSGGDLSKELNIIGKLGLFNISFNCIILYQEQPGYKSEIRQFIEGVINRNIQHTANPAVIAVNEKEETPQLINALRLLKTENPAPEKHTGFSGREYRPCDMDVPAVSMPLGIGGFTEDSGYLTDITGEDTPRPWSNIISYGNFGTLLTERGGGYTFLDNSREKKLTTFANSPSNDRLSELIIISEDGTEAVWTPVKAVDNGSRYVAVHSPGVTDYYNNYNGFNTMLTETVTESGKLYILKFINTRKKKRKLFVSLLLDVVLGENKMYTRRFVYAENVGEGIRICNADNGITVFADCNLPLKLNKIRNAMIDCNVSFGTEIEVEDSAELVFSLSVNPSAVTVQKAREAERSARDYFGNLSGIIAETPDKSLNILINKWLPYQILAARFNARCGYYQAGGAIGFRDQLQDAVNLLHVDSNILRQHILKCAAHQYIEGDVQHWWHFDRFGVRTRITDDLLFLPWAVCEYIRFTGDNSILAEQAFYLISLPLADGENARLETPDYSAETESIYLHCMRAILKAAKVGERGLCLMGTGDWNDAMDEVGHHGRGESVFVSMFLYYVVRNFLEHVTRDDDKKNLTNIARLLNDAVNGSAFCGTWFVRAFDDDGNVLGSPESRECKIDLLCQAWAALSGIAGRELTDTALENAAKYLVDADNGIIKLLSPAFKKVRAGYITDYPEGVRENGGQYTHAAVWFTKAVLKKDADEGYRLIKMLNPVNKHLNKRGTDIYKGEPYVVAADVYSHPDYTGMAGWTYYTGAAGHYYSTLIDTLLGITVAGDKLYINPNIPAEWNGFSVYLKRFDLTIEIKKTGKPAIIIDEIRYNMKYVMLTQGMRGKKIYAEI